MPRDFSSPTPPLTKKSLPRSVWLVSWVSFFADVSGEMIYPILPLFLVGVLGASKVELGMIEGSAIFVVSIMAAIAGTGSDRMGKRVPWIRWGYGLPVLGKAIISAAATWPVVFAGRLLDRFGKGLRGAPRDALIADAVEQDQRGRAFGLHRALDTTGALLGVLLSALLLWWLTGTPQKEGALSAAVSHPSEASVYRIIIAVGSLLGLLSLVLTFLIREPELPESTKGQSNTTPLFNSKTPSMPRSYWSLLGILVLFSIANSSDTFLLIRASDLGFSPWEVVLLYALCQVSYAALSYPAGVLSDRIGRWGIIAAGWVLYSGVYLAFGAVQAQQAWIIWPLIAIYGCFMALTEGVSKALIADVAPSDRRGTALGYFYAITGVSTLSANLLAGFIWDRFGAEATFQLGAACSGVALLGLVIFRNKQNKS